MHTQVSAHKHVHMSWYSIIQVCLGRLCIRQHTSTHLLNRAEWLRQYPSASTRAAATLAATAAYVPAPAGTGIAGQPVLRACCFALQCGQGCHGSRQLKEPLDLPNAQGRHEALSSCVPLATARSIIQKSTKNPFGTGQPPVSGGMYKHADI